MMSMVKNLLLSVSAAVFAAFLSGCATHEPHDQIFRARSKVFLYESLAHSPILATAAGYYAHKPQAGDEGEQAAAGEIRLDELLDDYSPEGIKKRLALYKDFQKLLHDPDRMNRDRELKLNEYADYGTVDDHISQVLFQFEKERVHEHNPAFYVEMLGTALYTPLVHEYAPKEERYRHLIARIGRIPAFLDQAKKNLKSSPEIWTQVAAEENEGNLRLVEMVIPAGLPRNLKNDFDKVSGPAIEALRGFGEYLTSDLSRRSQHDWRLGRQLYGQKFKIFLTSSKTPDELLSEAETEFDKTHKEMIETAKPIHKKIYGNQRPPTDAALMKDVFDVVSDENRLRNSSQMEEQIKKDIAELRTFLEQGGIVNLPASDNLKVVETPEFMRGIYSVAGFLGAPPLRPELGAYYWVTPIPADWPRSRSVSKLREYNLFKLKLLSAHEAMPGHWVQLEFANQGAENTPELSRLLRAVFPNQVYAEGWAVYMTDALVKAGYQDGSDEFKLNWLKDKLRVQANAILDIRMHTKNMSDEEAEKLLRTRAFQEAEEVRAKILRAKLSSTQLSLYFHGAREWLRVRGLYQIETTDMSLTSFHNKALRGGATGMDELAYLTVKLK